MYQPGRVVSVTQKNPDLNTTGLVSYGGSGPSSAGTATAVVNDHGDWVNYATAASAGDYAGWEQSGVLSYQLRHALQYHAVIQTGANVTDQINWAGFASLTPFSFGTDNLSKAGALAVIFRASSMSSDTTWKAVVSDGTTQTIHDTGVPWTADTTYELHIDIRDRTQAVFVVNRAIVAVAPCEHVNQSTPLAWGIAIETLANAAKNIRIAMCITAQQRYPE